MNSGKALSQSGKHVQETKLPRVIQGYRSFHGASCLVFKLEWQLWGSQTATFIPAYLLFSHCESNCVLIVYMGAHTGVYMFAYV